MVGSGPYRLETVKAGDSLTFRRNPDYWAKDIPSKRGFDNYDTITLTYFRDENAMFEAFKKGLVDVFMEENSGRWASQYDFPAVTRGDIVKETLKTRLPSGMLGIVMNTRRPVFQDPKLRAALIDLFDFEWANRSLFSGAYTRTKSFYDNSDLSSHGRPASEAEKALLAPFPGAVTPEIMAKGWTPPVSDGSGLDRAFMRVGFEKLKQAGYVLKDGRLTAPDGKPVAFEIMLKANENQQVAVAYQQTLAKLGIGVSIRSVDAAQFLERQINYDFDAMFFNYTASLSPGVEQVARWGSAAKDKTGHVQLCGRGRSGGGRDDRGADQCAHPRRVRRGGAGLRSRSFEWRLRRSALFQAGAMGRALEAHRAAGEDCASGIVAADLVARAELKDRRYGGAPDPHDRRRVRRRLPVVLPRPEAARQGDRRLARRRCRRELAAVPARPDHSA